MAPSSSQPPMTPRSPPSVPPAPSSPAAHPRPEVSMSPDTVAPVLPPSDPLATTRSSPGRPLSRHPNAGRPIFAVGGCAENGVVVAAGGIVSTVGGFDVSAVGSGSGASSISAVGTGSISTVGVVPPMDTPVPSLGPANPPVGSPPLPPLPSQPSASHTQPASPHPLRGEWVAGAPSHPSTSPTITQPQPASAPLPDPPLGAPFRPGLPRLPMPAAPPLPPVSPGSLNAQSDDPVAEADEGWEEAVRGVRPPNEEEIGRTGKKSSRDN